MERKHTLIEEEDEVMEEVGDETKRLREQYKEELQQMVTVVARPKQH